jgi:geranylgeranylglycerol-phosphate geranylgeranyltransferase
MIRRSSLTPLRALAQITRPQIAAQAAVYSFLGAYLGTEARSTFSSATAIAALLVGIVVAFGFVINDYADAELDRLTKPERPIPSGSVGRAEAGAIALTLAGLALALATFAPARLWPIVALNLALTTAYSLALKNTVLIGNMTMAFLNCSIIAFGALAAGESTLLTWLVVAMIFVYTLAQEVLYTVADRRGDALAGLRTTAIYFGAGPALWLFRGLIAAFGLAALLPWWAGLASPLYLAALLLCTLLPIGLRIIPLTFRQDDGAILSACETVKWVRLSSLVPLILLPLLP